MLYECRTWGREISRNARVCPGCGEPDAGAPAAQYFEMVILPRKKLAQKDSKRRVKQLERIEEAEKAAKQLGATVQNSTLVIFFLVGAFWSARQYPVEGANWPAIMFGVFACAPGIIFGSVIGPLIVEPLALRAKLRRIKSTPPPLTGL
jgi:hypothetical protein